MNARQASPRVRPSRWRNGSVAWPPLVSPSELPDHRMLQPVRIDGPAEDFAIDIADGHGRGLSATGQSWQKVRAGRGVPEERGARTRGGVPMVADDVATIVDSRGYADVAEHTEWVSRQPQHSRGVERVCDQGPTGHPAAVVHGQTH